MEEACQLEPRYGRLFKSRYGTIPGITAVFGDNITRMERPTIVKTRLIGDPNGVLLPLNYERHWGIGPKQITPIDVPWNKKIKSLVWRGATTGKQPYEAQPRTMLIRRWHGHADAGIDVGVSKIVQNKEFMRPYVAKFMTVQDQLQHAYIISVEGNDVATNLKWILASNSIPIMPPPRYESWLLESQLKPWVHYVPVAVDFEDLVDVLAWCRANDAKCQEIAEQGKMYVAPFFDLTSEGKLEKAVINSYVGGSP